MRDGLIFGLGVVAVLALNYELSRALHGPEWALAVAAICITITQMGALVLLGRWIEDRRQRRAREKADSEQRSRPVRTPEQERQLAEFHHGIGKAMADALNKSQEGDGKR